MTALPDSIESNLDFNPNQEVQNRHFLEVFAESERPFLSRSYVQDQVGLSGEATRLRLGTLVERGLLGTTEIAGANVYWLNHPESKWPMPPDVEVTATQDALTVDELLDQTWVHFGLTGGVITLLGSSLIGMFTVLAVYSVSLPVIQKENLLVWGIAALLMSFILFGISLVLWLRSRLSVLS